MNDGKTTENFTNGTFIILFGFYLSPVVKEAKYKNKCIQYSTKSVLTEFNKDDIGEIY